LVPGVRRKNWLAIACKAISLYLRLAKKMAKEDPHIFGPCAQKYFVDTLEQERIEKEFEAVLARVRGSGQPSKHAHVSTLWRDRYFPRPENRRMFLECFHRNYTKCRQSIH
jgi:hypothetical protein